MISSMNCSSASPSARDAEVVGDVGVDLDDDVAVELQRLQIGPVAEVADHERPTAWRVRQPGGSCRIQRWLLEDDQRLGLAGLEVPEGWRS